MSNNKINLFGKEMNQEQRNSYGDCFMNEGVKQSNERIKERFSAFYEDHKEKLEAGTLIYIEESFCLEGGVFIDLETHESIFLDYRC